MARMRSPGERRRHETAWRAPLRRGTDLDWEAGSVLKTGDWVLYGSLGSYEGGGQILEVGSFDFLILTLSGRLQHIHRDNNCFWRCTDEAQARRAPLGQIADGGRRTTCRGAVLDYAEEDF